MRNVRGLLADDLARFITGKTLEADDNQDEVFKVCGSARERLTRRTRQRNSRADGLCVPFVTGRAFGGRSTGIRVG